jgi:hypothetical protein
MRHPQLTLVLCLAAASGGCLVYDETPRARVAVTASTGYTPMYYDGYVVYYDDFGRPFYYVEGRPHFVPRTRAEYRVYRRHYHDHGTRYREWYRREGYRYRNDRPLRRYHR